MKKNVLLICPHSAIEVFKESKISVVIPHIPYISLASLAAALLKDGHRVKILDLSVSADPYADLNKTLEIFPPDFAGITFTIGLYQEAMAIAKRIKDYDKNIKVVAGGAHPSIFPLEIAGEPSFDLAVYGEGENTLSEIVAGHNPAEIKGLAYKKEDGRVVINEQRELIKDLDLLPYPAYYLYDPKKYHSPRVTSRKNPVAAIETSRGCPYNCIFCSKQVFQRVIRFKTPPRVVDEMEILLNLGYREIHIWDDCFSADLNHAKGVCDEIIKRDLRVCWNIYNGIRVDRVDEELLVKLKKAGCYRVSFGVESGDQGVLDRAKKGITIDQIKSAFKL
ncbi:MAG: radical SAM protein, partial [Patescibacteria group bacterium]